MAPFRSSREATVSTGPVGFARTPGHALVCGPKSSRTPLPARRPRGPPCGVSIEDPEPSPRLSIRLSARERETGGSRGLRGARALLASLSPVGRAPARADGELRAPSSGDAGRRLPLTMEPKVLRRSSYDAFIGGGFVVAVASSSRSRCRRFKRRVRGSSVGRMRRAGRRSDSARPDRRVTPQGQSMLQGTLCAKSPPSFAFANASLSAP